MSVSTSEAEYFHTVYLEVANTSSDTNSFYWKVLLDLIMNIVYNILSMDKSRKEIFKLCKDKYLRRLYAATGQLRYVYKLPNVIRVICIAYVGELPIGVSFLLKRQTHINTLQLYVKPEYRKLGIGTKLVRNLSSFFVGKETYYESDENKIFWRKVMNINSKTEMTVRGINRTVHLGKFNQELNGWPALTYVNSKSVTGIVRENALGARRFYPKGKNAELV